MTGLILGIIVPSILVMIVLILFKPSILLGKVNISIYWIAPLIGAIILLCAKVFSLEEIWLALSNHGAINPIKILILFFSMSMLSIYLDEIGFFKYLASYVINKSNSSQLKIFVFLYLAISLLTIFTSNDIIILTFTPFICYFCKNAKINPIPFLITEFIAANTWSILLIIGNPTNIYLSTMIGLDFIEYTRIMILPTFFAGLTSFIVLLLVFKKEFAKPIEAKVDLVFIKNKTLLFIGIAHLFGCLLFLIISNYIGLEMWTISLLFSISLVIFVTIYKIFNKGDTNEIITTIKRVPWELIPFVISMFIFVLALDKVDITKNIAILLGNTDPILKYGITSTFLANIVNNIPMSVMFGSIISNLDKSILAQATYSTIIGSNIGAYLTPIGALAGIMWMQTLAKHNIKFNFLDFIKYGIVISIPTLLMALLGLSLVLN